MAEIASATNRVEKADSKAEVAMLMEWYITRTRNAVSTFVQLLK